MTGARIPPYALGYSMNASAAPGRAPTPARLSPGAKVGGVTVTGPLRVAAMAEVYAAEAPGGQACTLYIVHDELARAATVRTAVLAAAKRAVAAGDHKHLVRTLGAGVDGAFLWVATDALDGSTMRDLLSRKRQTSGAAGGFGARGAGNLVIGVAAGLGVGGVHGGLSTDSVIVSRNGRVRVCDLALGAGHAAAVAAGVLPTSSHVAPEIAKGGAPSAEADVYGLGALLYEALVGRALERGGPRPSEVVAGLTSTIDEIIARTCAPSPDKRFGSVEVVREVVAEALGRGAAVDEDGGQATPAPRRNSLAHAIANPSGPVAAASSGTFNAATSGSMASSSGSMIAAAAVDPALAAALADSTEKWLLSKGRLDYGPFSLQGIVDQIKAGEIVAGNVIVDKDTGGRIDVAEHPLLGAMLEASRQQRDDARRAHAEVHHQTKEKKRNVLLFAVIGLVLVAVGVVIFLIVGSVTKKKADEVTGVAKVGGGSLDVKMSEPKKLQPKKKSSSGGSRSGGSRSGGGGGGGDDDDEMLALDMSGDDDTSEPPLDMGTIYSVYSKYGGQLGGCMSRTGENYANIGIIIEGKSGKVNWVRVNGSKSGALYDCISRVMRSMKFPSINAARSRAEFDISL